MNNFYDNDLDLNNSVIIYCEGVLGNPLKGKYIIRWILSELGTNVPYENIYSWNKTDKIYLPVCVCVYFSKFIIYILY